MPLNPGGDSLLIEKAYEPTWDDLTTGVWFANDEGERERMRAFMRKGFAAGTALTAARSPEYARHILGGWAKHLTPGEFSVAQAKAKRRGIETARVLAEMGYSPKAERENAEDPIARLNREREKEWERWFTDPIPGEPAPDLEVPIPTDVELEDADERGRLSAIAQRIREAGGGGRTSPSQLYEGRRARGIRLKAKELGISVEEAEAITPRRGPGK